MFDRSRLRTLCRRGVLVLLFLMAVSGCGRAPGRAAVAERTLFHAAETGDLDRVRAIVEADKGALRAVRGGGRTALHYAAEGDQPEVVEFLIQAGAEVDATNPTGYTPLHIAAMSGDGSLNAARALIAHGADVNARTGSKALEALPIPRGGFSVVGIAASRGHAELIELLLKHKARVVDDADADSLSPMHLAATGSVAPKYLKDPKCAGNAVVIRLLVGQGVDVNIRNYKRQTPLHIAAENGAVDTIRFLVETYEDVQIDAEDGNGNTPLHLAAYSPGYIVPSAERTAVTRFLLSKGAKQVKNSSGQTPLERVRSAGQGAVVEALFNAGQ